jgi:TolB-like protein/Flp pilus assembly protein TadD/tRNA A-37 threonylcarbamoyl transferase component Bud32
MPAKSKNARVCERCGAPLETTSAGDLGCIACLLGAGLDADEQQSEALLTAPLAQLGAYTIEHHPDGSVWELGRGAMGVTYRAIDKALDRNVALKIINTDRGSRSAEARERFMREARAAAALRHSNVATVYQFGVCEGTGQFFYAMELVEGETLEERVRRLGPLDVLSTIDIALQVTAALEAAEERGLVHRDLKPGNLMLMSQGNLLVATDRRVVRRARRARPGNSGATVKVIDFGVAKAVVEKTNAMALTHGGFVGTPAFASPEQFTNAPVDVRSDIYSLGATLWFLLTGQMLFSGRTIEEIQEARQSKPLPVVQLEAAHVPHRLISLLASMLAIEPAARPSGACELARRLQAIRDSITGRGKIAVRVVLAAAIVALAAIAVVREFRSFATKPTPSAIPDKSIAVLPFENLSGDPNNAYFAEGMQEEILTRLAKIAGLKVISRTSTQRYQGKPQNLGEIAKQLAVANLLEGSVQKTADQVRVNVQLINAQTDSHLWADTYDRKLSDVFGIESEIAKAVAESLQAKLTSREEHALAAKPTNNQEAYDAYLRGVASGARSAPFASWEAVGLYEQAVQLDNNFSIAWARLSRAESLMYIAGDDKHGPLAARADAAKRALEKAQRLQPNSPETLLALGYYQYRVVRDFGAAKTTFGRVAKLLPGSSEALYALGRVARLEGHFDECITYLEQAIALDPANPELLDAAGFTYALLKQFPAALKLYDRALDIKPTDPRLLAYKAGIYQGQGNLQEAAKLLSGTNETANKDVFEIKILQLQYERNYREAIRLLQARLIRSASDYDKADAQVALAYVQRLAGDTAEARVTAAKARDTLERRYRGKSDEVRFTNDLSYVYAVMGERELAIKLAQRAVLLLPRSKDPIYGPGYEENLAQVQTMLGENSSSVIATLAQLLETSYQSTIYRATGVTPAILRLDPVWDPLRSDPAFQKLCGEKQRQSVFSTE